MGKKTWFRCLIRGTRRLEGDAWLLVLDFRCVTNFKVNSQGIKPWFLREIVESKHWRLKQFIFVHLATFTNRCKYLASWSNILFNTLVIVMACARKWLLLHLVQREIEYQQESRCEKIDQIWNQCRTLNSEFYPTKAKYFAKWS